MPPLYQMNPQERFSDRAQAYAQYRPGYPPEAIAAVLAGQTSAQIADIGAGTGISADLLAEQGAQVWAVEPNAAMRQAGQSHPHITWVDGNAEATGLPDKMFDCVTCFQSFHWFNPTLCLPEFRRILKPAGRLALVWNDRNQADGFTAGYSEIVRRLSDHHPAEAKLVGAEPLVESPDFANLRDLSFSYSQAMDLSGLIGRALSVSYLPQDESTLQQLHAELSHLYHQWADHNGFVSLVYQTQVFLADVVMS